MLGYGSGSESTYVVADDAKIFFIDDDGTITEGAVSNIRRSDEDVVTYVLEDGQISYLFVQQYFEDNDQSSSGGRQELTSITDLFCSQPDPDSERHQRRPELQGHPEDDRCRCDH